MQIIIILVISHSHFYHGELIIFYLILWVSNMLVLQNVFDFTRPRFDIDSDFKFAHFLSSNYDNIW